MLDEPTASNTVETMNQPQHERQHDNRDDGQDDDRKKPLTYAVLGAVTLLLVFLGIAMMSSGQDATMNESGQVSVVGDKLPEYLPEYADGTDGDPAVGLAAPEFNGVGFDDRTVSFTAGEPTLLVFLAHWCAVCQAEVPALVDWYADGSVPVDVVAVATMTDANRPNYPPSSWLKAEGWPTTWPVLADSSDFTAASSYGTTAFPYFVLVGQDGNVLWRSVGKIDTSDLALRINQALLP